jgi:hypothetical protein
MATENQQDTPQPEANPPRPGFFRTLLHPLRLAQSILRERAKAKNRSPLWNNIRDEHLRKYPECGACGGKKHLQVHHVEPYHLHPELELALTNLATLCMGRLECHLTLGHGDDFRAFNPLVLHHVIESRKEPRKRRIIEEAARSARRYQEAKVA